MGSVAPAVDTHGRLYVAFEDMGANDPRVVVMHSDAGGGKWSEPVAVSEARPARRWDWPTLLPWMAVAPNGRLDVAWYAYRDDVVGVAPAGDQRPTLQDVYYSFSTDGGRTWAANRRVNDREIDRAVGIAAGQSDVNGPVALASTDRTALVAWDDSRNGRPENGSQDVYFTRVRFDAAAVDGGDRWTPALWSALGLGAGLAVSGLVLVLVGRRARRVPVPAVVHPTPVRRGARR